VKLNTGTAKIVYSSRDKADNQHNAKEQNCKCKLIKNKIATDSTT